ncbi:MAG: response regulator [Actinomycetota bacterium]
MNLPIRPRVLICDDDPDIRTVVGLNLGLVGMEFGEASDGEEALAALEAGWDALVLDLMMPGRDGFDVLRSLKEHEVKGLAIVVLSARSSPHTAHQALELGAHAHVTKPFSPLALSQLLTELIDLDDEQRESFRAEALTRASRFERMGIPTI